MTRDEGRLMRWSRLKRRGGSSDAEQAEAEPQKKATNRAGPAPVPVATVDDMPDPATLPGGVQKRDFAPAMPPLAGPEDDNLTDVPAAFVGDAAKDDEEEKDIPRELTPEEEEATRDLPPIETLDKDSDFTPFMAEGVPEFIRRQALRVLWRSHPVLGFVDGLDDYAENFRVIDKLIAAADSSYVAGKGYPEAPFHEQEKEPDEAIGLADNTNVGDSEVSSNEVDDAGEGEDETKEGEDTGEGEDETEEELVAEELVAEEETKPAFSRHDVRPPDEKT